MPTQIDFSNDTIAVAFDHITTLWSYDAYDGVSFVNDLIHCDSTDAITELKFVQENYIMCVHHHCLNVWNLKNDSNATSAEAQLMKSTPTLGHTISCVWSAPVDQVLSVCENPLQKSQLILFVRTNRSQPKNVNEQTPAEIKSKQNKIPFFLLAKQNYISMWK